MLVPLNASISDVRQKLVSKVSDLPEDAESYSFTITKEIEQMWLDDKVSLKAYNIKDGVCNSLYLT